MLNSIKTINYKNVQTEYAQLVGVDSNLIKIYLNGYLAAYDISSSLLSFYSHKPKVGLIKQGSSIPDTLVPHFLKTQIKVQNKDPQQTIDQFLFSLDSDTNFVLWSSENEITGEINLSKDESLRIHKTLSDKKIFSIQIIQENRHFYDKLSFNDFFCKLADMPYAIQIVVPSLFSSNKSFIFHSEKFKAPTKIEFFQDLEFEGLFPNRDDQKPTKLAMREVKLPKQLFYQNLYSNPKPILSDRLVLFLKNVRGSAILEKLNLNSTKAFAPSHFPSWTNESAQSWWEDASKEQLMRSLVVIASDVVNKDLNFEEKLVNGLQELTNQSNILF